MTTRILMAAALGSFATAASAQNLILNPGFELGTGGDADNWEEIGGPSGATIRSDAMPFAGGWHASMSYDHVANTPSAAPFFIQQVSPANSIDPLVNYDFSFYAKLDGTDLVGLNVFA
ncbi:MAG: hypothetical protein AAGB48_11775, partial [Planctomycetota bacterium]